MFAERLMIGLCFDVWFTTQINRWLETRNFIAILPSTIWQIIWIFHWEVKIPWNWQFTKGGKPSSTFKDFELLYWCSLILLGGKHYTCHIWDAMGRFWQKKYWPIRAKLAPIGWKINTNCHNAYPHLLSTEFYLLLI